MLQKGPLRVSQSNIYTIWDKKLRKKTLRNTIPFIFVRIYHANVIERI